MAFMTAPSTSSTNDVNTANPAFKSSTVSLNVNTASPQVSTANFSDNVVYAFMVENPNGSNLIQQDLKKIHKDDLEEMDLRWQLSLKYEGKKKNTLSHINEVLFSKEVAVLKRDVACKDYEINVLKSEFEKVKQEKEGIEFKINKFDNASKSLDKLIGSQITNNSKKGLGYHVVPPPHPLIYNGPTKLDLSYTGLDEFKEPEFKGYGPRNNKLESNINHDQKSDDSKENSNDSFVKQRVSEDTSSFVKFTWVFFLATKDETSEILKNFIKEIENLVDKIVKIIICDNETEFKNKVMDDIYREKGIKKEYSVARTPQQNGVAERRNRTLTEASRTMVLIVKPHTMTPYELFRSFKLALSFMRPFRCQVTILNTFDNLGKFDGKSNEGFFVGYSLSSKAFRIYNTRTKKAEENLHIRFLENKPMIEGNGTQGDLNAGTSSWKEATIQDYIVMPIWKDASYFDTPSKDVKDGTHNEDDDKDKSEDDSSLKEVNVAGQHVNTTSLEVNNGASNTLEATHVAFFSDRDVPKVDLGNILNSYGVPTTSHTTIHKDHPIENQCRKNFCNLSSNKFGYLWIFIMERRPLEQGHRQEEGIDYEEVFAPLARIKVIRLFLAYVSFMGFLVYQMDVKSAFLYGTIEEKVYVTQPLGFKDPNHPDKVYKVVKALYGLHQAPKAWYDTFANYLLSNGFQRGKIDPTLFIKKQRGDILLVQIMELKRILNS
nr:ribonuclease H-like domain-containing protein [Tanacetum cinerariifolium]